MTKEVIATGKTVDAAVAAGAAELGQPAERVSYEILEEPRKGILGIGAVDAKLRVFLTDTPALRAVGFVEKIIENMQIEATVQVINEDEEGIALSVEGENLGLLIGRRGDVLDALQYLTTLAANIGRSGFFRVSLDIQGYRAKREDVLKGVAHRMSEKVLKYKRSFALEPMNAYERRIIHSECQKIEGVATRSVGEGADRKIVISPEKK